MTQRIKTVILLIILSSITIGLIMLSSDIKPASKEITITIPYNANH
jgi:hypothetical protein